MEQRWGEWWSKGGGERRWWIKGGVRGGGGARVRVRVRGGGGVKMGVKGGCEMCGGDVGVRGGGVKVVEQRWG